MWKRIKFYAVLTVMIALVAMVAYLWLFGARPGGMHRIADPPALVREIQRLRELATVKYSLQKVIGLKEEKTPFGEESLLLLVQATVLAGVDLTALDASHVAVVDDRCVSIQLPAAKVLHVFINDPDTWVWDRSKTWWTPWVPFNPDLDQKARLAALEAVQVAALEMGILTNAQQNAEKTIREFLRLAGIETVRFTPSASSPTSSHAY